MIIKITELTAGERLDKFLTGALKNLSRSQIQLLIENGGVLVNNQSTNSHYRLKADDSVKVKKIAKKPAAEKASDNSTADLPKIKIIEETGDFLVIDKPSGLAVHGPDQFTLAKWLVKKYPKIKTVGDDPERPGIVHRLDKDVSGLMVIAKTKTSFQDLKNQFQNRSIDKEYTALAYGQIAKESGEINFPLTRSRDGYKMAALPLTDKGRPTASGREALTKFTIERRFINFTLLKVKIITGRTHQIRAHLAAYGYPLVGDNIYATAKTRLRNKKLALNRIFLAADKLSFADLTGKRLDFKINLPAELKNILEQIK